MREWEKVADPAIDVFLVLWLPPAPSLTLKPPPLPWLVTDTRLDRPRGACMFISESLPNSLPGVCGSNPSSDIHERPHCTLIFNRLYCYYKYCSYPRTTSGKKKLSGTIFSFVFAETEFYFSVILNVHWNLKNYPHSRCQKDKLQKSLNKIATRSF